MFVKARLDDTAGGVLGEHRPPPRGPASSGAVIAWRSSMSGSCDAAPAPAHTSPQALTHRPLRTRTRTPPSATAWCACLPAASPLRVSAPLSSVSRTTASPLLAADMQPARLHVDGTRVRSAPPPSHPHDGPFIHADAMHAAAPCAVPPAHTLGKMHDEAPYTLLVFLNEVIAHDYRLSRQQPAGAFIKAAKSRDEGGERGLWLASLRTQESVSGLAAPKLRRWPDSRHMAVFVGARLNDTPGATPAGLCPPAYGLPPRPPASASHAQTPSSLRRAFFRRPPSLSSVHSDWRSSATQHRAARHLAPGSDAYPGPASPSSRATVPSARVPRYFVVRLLPSSRPIPSLPPL
ncbi:hypothetical protein HYPSUDRAFT_209185 [Hypholoma sublateritium FD-334 SS-4]|uniref:Uncharacterized protein n=1 Tax=Hypholoma sublateritium (strain FD-334 SS-4) TaxID=945553 RepID=A0A0D2N3Q0_HYPSF|nr:hypothetical protein HYPSUDRAFT_209185 [Hypholoma sublateritium FD-334 SS-4]